DSSSIARSRRHRPMVGQVGGDLPAAQALRAVVLRNAAPSQRFAGYLAHDIFPPFGRRRSRRRGVVQGLRIAAVPRPTGRAAASCLSRTLPDGYRSGLYGALGRNSAAALSQAVHRGGALRAAAYTVERSMGGKDRSILPAAIFTCSM